MWVNVVRTKLFGVGKLADVCKTFQWVSPTLQSSHETVGVEGACDRARFAEQSTNIDDAGETFLSDGLPRRLSSAYPNPSRLISFVSTCTSPSVSFEDVQFLVNRWRTRRTRRLGRALDRFLDNDNVVLSAIELGIPVSTTRSPRPNARCSFSSTTLPPRPTFAGASR
jgi:hypothetical protein